MNENLKRLIVAFLFGLAVAIIAWVMLPGSSWQVLFSILFFGTVLEIVLERAEAGTATGRTLAHLIPWGAGVLVFIALRIAGGYLLGLPIAMVYGNLFESVESFRSANQTLAIEVLFSALAVGLTCAAIKSERARKWLYAGTCIAFVVILYQVKAPETSSAISRVFNASTARTNNYINYAADYLEEGINPKHGLSKVKTTLYKLQADKNFKEEVGSSGKPLFLEEGIVVKFEGESKTFHGDTKWKICLANPDTGDFVAGQRTAWVNKYDFDWDIEVGPNNQPINPRLAKN